RAGHGERLAHGRGLGPVREGGGPRLGGRPETRLGAESQSERVPFGGSCERRAAAGKSRRGKTEAPWGRLRALHRGHVVSSHALTLRQVCRAGFAGRGTPLALSTGRHSPLSVRDPRLPCTGAGAPSPLRFGAAGHGSGSDRPVRR